jgi:drug/metabolite transporter (DMT)-like permease
MFFKERITWQHIVGMVICLAGLVLVTKAHRGESRLFYFGIAVLVLAVVAEVAYATLTKALTQGYKPTVIVMYQFFIGSLFFLPLFLTRGMENYTPEVYGSWSVWEPILCLSILCSTIAFALWAYAIGKLGVAKSSIFQALNPVVTALAGFVLGDEILCGAQWVGLAIAIGGVILTQLNLGGKDLFARKDC